MGTDVAEEVVDHLAQPVLVAHDDGIGRIEVEVDHPVGVDDTRIVDCRSDQTCHIDTCVLEWATLIEAGQQQQVVDEYAHADRFLLDPMHRSRRCLVVRVGAARQLGVPADRRERRSQFV